MNLIDGVYLHRGGSKVLLQQLVDTFGDDEAFFFLLDCRVKLSVMPKRFVTVTPGELSRLVFYMKNGGRFSRILCMGNVPPPLRQPCPTVTYFHNRLYLEPGSCGAGMLTRWLLWLKRVYILLFATNTDCFAVQTRDFAAGFTQHFGVHADKVLLWPFWPEGAFRAVVSTSRSRENFGYVSLPYPHKRHDALLRAWELLADSGVYPELHLTIPEQWTEILALVRRARENGARIVNHGFCNPAEIYGRCAWQIYPSESESFGLGLIESVEGGCAVVAPELSYVREVVNPSVVWQGSSPGAIAEAVRRCLGGDVPDSNIVISNKIEAIATFFKKPIGDSFGRD